MSRAPLGVALCLSLLALVACETPPAATASPSPAPSSGASTLPRPDEERAVREALEREGARVSNVIPTKFDWLFGSAAPRAAIFELVAGGTQTWVDVHFLERRVDGVTACGATGGRPTFTVAVNGRPETLGAPGEVTGSLSSGTMYFAASDRMFVMTPDLPLRDLSRRALGLAIPPCREPASLPVLPQEAAVVAALEAAGIAITVVGASKFEAMLGERLPARVFIAREGAGGAGAEVLFLPGPITDPRVCVSQASTGLTRYEVFIGGRRVSGGEGVPVISFSANDRYFVQSFGGEFHAALMRGLGTRELRC